jgi:hypothetical protein
VRRVGDAPAVYFPGPEPQRAHGIALMDWLPTLEAYFWSVSIKLFRDVMDVWAFAHAAALAPELLYNEPTICSPTTRTDFGGLVKKNII